MTKTPAFIGHIEIPAPSVKKAVDFYRSVFQWECDDPSESHCMFACGEGRVAGAFAPTRKPSDDGPLLYLQVEEMNNMLAAVESAGGTVLAKKAAIEGGYGFLGFFRDPNGNRLGLWSRE